LVWQRLLMTIYGSNNESVAMVVASFLTGLGLGSLAGGQISKQRRIPLVLVFAVTELFIGIYGILSVPLFRWIGDYGSGAGTIVTGFIVFGLVFLPTLLMGSTLPVLVAQQIDTTHEVGSSVSWLYFANTIGATLGAFLTAFVILGALGISGTVRFAAALNLLAALTVAILWKLRRLTH
jgi:predicted membrane-bound spermidine synthase